MCEYKNQKSNDGKPEAAAEKKDSLSNIETPVTKDSEYFETALEATKFGKFNYLIVVVSGLVLTNVLLETVGLSFVLPVSHCDLRLTTQERGILSATGFAGIICSSHLWGFLADTQGRRKIIRPTLLLAFVLTVISSFSNSFWLLVTLRFLNGFCVSASSATIYAYLGEFHTSKTRSRAIMGSAFIFGVTAMLLPLLAWLVINQEWRFVVPFINVTYKPWRLFIVVCGVPGVLCGLTLFKIPESPKFLLSQKEEAQVVLILRKIYRINTGDSAENYPYSHVLEDLDIHMTPRVRAPTSSNPASAMLRSMWQQTQPLFNAEHIRSTVLVCSIQFWIFVTSNGMYMWFPHILNIVMEFINGHPNEHEFICQMLREKHETTQFDTPSSDTEVCNEKLEISTYHHSLILEIMYAAGFAIIGMVIDVAGKVSVLFFCLVVGGLCGIATIYVDMPMLAIYLYMTMLLSGVAASVVSAATVDLYPTRLRAMAICIALMMGRLGSVAGTNTIGILLDYNCEAAFITPSVALIASGFLAFFLPRPPKTSQHDSNLRRSSYVSMTGN